MKLVLSILMLLFAAICNAQDMRIILSAKGEKLSVSLDDDNSKRTFIIKQTNITNNNYFTAAVSNEETGTDWKRSFIIHNAEDSEIAALKYMHNNSYCISLKELGAKLQPGNQYYLYTIALPQDPKKAMLVKVARRLVCKIIIKD